MAKCAIRRTPLRLRLWFYIIQGLKNTQQKNSLSMANGGVINRFLLVKAAMIAPRVCKSRRNCLTIIDQCLVVLKTPQFLDFSIIYSKCAINFHSPYLKWLPNCQFQNREALSYFKGLSEDGGRADFSKNLWCLSL
jgi:hypothetical protein